MKAYFRHEKLRRYFGAVRFVAAILFVAVKAKREERSRKNIIDVLSHSFFSAIIFNIHYYYQFSF